jgi:hypothetical protein
MGISVFSTGVELRPDPGQLEPPRFPQPRTALESCFTIIISKTILAAFVNPSSYLVCSILRHAASAKRRDASS